MKWTVILPIHVSSRRLRRSLPRVAARASFGSDHRQRAGGTRGADRSSRTSGRQRRLAGDHFPALAPAARPSCRKAPAYCREYAGRHRSATFWTAVPSAQQRPRCSLQRHQSQDDPGRGRDAALSLQRRLAYAAYSAHQRIFSELRPRKRTPGLPRRPSQALGNHSPGKRGCARCETSGADGDGADRDSAGSDGAGGGGADGRGDRTSARRRASDRRQPRRSLAHAPPTDGLER